MARLTDLYGVFIGVMIHIAANGINLFVCVYWRYDSYIRKRYKSLTKPGWLVAGRYVPCGVSYYGPACISLILDIRPPARPGVPPSWCAGGDKTEAGQIGMKTGGFPPCISPSSTAMLLSLKMRKQQRPKTTKTPPAECAAISLACSLYHPERDRSRAYRESRYPPYPAVV